MHVQIQPTTPTVGTAAANTQVQITIPAPGAGRRTMLCDVAFSFSGAAATAPVRATISDGVTTLGIGVTSTTVFNPSNPIRMAENAVVTITLPAGGVSAVGDIVATSYSAAASE
jgi:hypothetical protein